MDYPIKEEPLDPEAVSRETMVQEPQTILLGQSECAAHLQPTAADNHSPSLVNIKIERAEIEVKIERPEDLVYEEVDIEYDAFKEEKKSAASDLNMKQCSVMLVKLPDKPHYCGQCSDIFNNPDNLKRQKLIHSVDKPYQCDKCCFTCKHKVTLKMHKATHSGTAPFKCNQCSYSCKQKNNLIRHKLIHSEEKPYQCDQCYFTCKQKGNLKRHQLIHSGEEPYQCDQCNYTCKQKGNLIRHKLIHSGK